MRWGALHLSVLVLLGGCAMARSVTAPDGAVRQRAEVVRQDAVVVGKAADAEGRHLSVAAETPLHDINVLRAKIPPVLLDAMDAPYATPAPLDCSTIMAEVLVLDGALGPDLDHAAPVAKQNRVQRGESLAGEGVYDAVRGAAEGLIPMRYWVRKLSGAEQRDKLVRASITAGTVRRGYLKGLGLSLACDPPAAPLPGALEAVAKQHGPQKPSAQRAP